MSYIDFMSGDGEPLADREERDLRERRESQTQRDEPPEPGPSQVRVHFKVPQAKKDIAMV